MDTYDLRKTLTEFIDTTALANPHDIAIKFAAQVPEAHLRTALAQALDQYVRVDIGRRRMHMDDPPVAQRSTKVTAIREAWRSALASRYHVGDGAWKFLADCELADVVFAARERRVTAERINTKAAELEALAAAMSQHHAAQVRDVPDEVLAEIFGGTR